MIQRTSVRWSGSTNRGQGDLLHGVPYLILPFLTTTGNFSASTGVTRSSWAAANQWGNIVRRLWDLIRGPAAKAFPPPANESLRGFTWPLVTKADGTKVGNAPSPRAPFGSTRRPHQSPYAFYQFWLNARAETPGSGTLLRTFHVSSTSPPQSAETQPPTKAEPGARRDAPPRSRPRLRSTEAVQGPHRGPPTPKPRPPLFSADFRRPLRGPHSAEVLANVPSSAHSKAHGFPPRSRAAWDFMITNRGLATAQGARPTSSPPGRARSPCTGRKGPRSESPKNSPPPTTSSTAHARPLRPPRQAKKTGT